VKHWGWAIVLLTLSVKVVLYPLTHASYKSMARMKALAPKMEKLKAQYGDDKAKLQQAMMAMYREEKVNPVGGCLPMLLQIPVFIGLYWALLGSVELRQAHFLWITDLSRPDPYYILPVILAITMFLQTFLNPPAADPVQAKMMRIMPLAFSVMFFFFPAGLVVYWLVNNILTMSQQWYVNNHTKLKK
jgi:YidC/Oxa1 family membrane protein insertase